jgi:hypothetical protein
MINQEQSTLTTEDMREMILSLLDIINTTRSCSEDEMYDELAFHGVTRERIDIIRNLQSH